MLPLEKAEQIEHMLAANMQKTDLLVCPDLQVGAT